MMDKKPIWIWIENQLPVKNDYYADFLDDFCVNSGKTILRVSCDSAFFCELNGKLVAFSRCADYPEYKLYDEYDITEFCGKENKLFFTVWYVGEDSQTYINAPAGLWYEVINDGRIVARSDEQTLGRFNRHYKSGACKWITPQLGFSFAYDNTDIQEDEFMPCVKAVHRNVLPRPQKTLQLEDRFLVNYKQDGDVLLVDMGKETAGYADLDFESPCEQNIVIAYGEYLKDGRVAGKIDERDFTFEIRAKQGRNTLFFPLRRIAGRYLEVIAQQQIKPIYIGIRSVMYPVTPIERKFDDAIIQKIYDVSVDTLRLCMHEHYEDCPWREQALYTLDSRYQMLYGYYAFKEREYQRANLLLMSKGLRKDGLLSLCFPAGRDIPIPSFSLAYILQVCEYVEYTGDRTLLEEVGDVMKIILSTFEEKIDSNGLIPTQPYPYWNFYEWTEGNDKTNEIGRKAEDPFVKDYELIINCLYVYAATIYNKTVGETFKTDSIKQAVVKELYDEDVNAYSNSIRDKRKGQLGNALAILIELKQDGLLEQVANCKGMTKASLSMRYFVYEALLTNKAVYKNFVLDDIKKNYLHMLEQGATSFWETDNGWQDWGGAGSCCHGWSALPIYYFSTLLQ